MGNKKVYKSIRFKQKSKTEYEIFNENFFITNSNLTFDWALLDDGLVVKEEQLLLGPLAPQDNTTFNILFNYEFNPINEYFINLYVRTNMDQSLVGKGHIVAKDQFLVQKAEEILGVLTKKKQGIKELKNGEYLVSGEGYI